MDDIKKNEFKVCLSRFELNTSISMYYSNNHKYGFVLNITYDWKLFADYIPKEMEEIEEMEEMEKTKEMEKIEEMEEIEEIEEIVQPCEDTSSPAL